MTKVLPSNYEKEACNILNISDKIHVRIICKIITASLSVIYMKKQPVFFFISTKTKPLMKNVGNLNAKNKQGLKETLKKNDQNIIN